MKNARSLMLALCGVAILTISLVLSSIDRTQAASAEPAALALDVNVVNTPNVLAHQSGPWTVGASQSGTWSVAANQSGPWSVSLNGSPTVQLNNSPTNPLSVRDVNNPDMQPFQRELDALIPPGQFTATDSLTVPAGKRLVIDFASETVNVPTGQHMWVRIRTTTNGSTNEFTLTPSVVCLCGADNSDFLAGNQPLHLYADPGTTVSVVVNMFLTPANTNSGADVVMSGHYINVP